MMTSARWLLSTALAIFVVPPVFAQTSNPIVPGTEGMVGRQLRGVLLLQGPGSQIGVSARDLTAAEALPGQDNWLTNQSGVVIEEVNSWSPASRAGLLKGDLITIFDG